MKRKSRDCVRFMALMDCLIHEEAMIDLADKEFYLKHCLACSTCALEAAFIDELRRMGSEAPVLELDDADLEQKAREILRREILKSMPAVPHRRLAWAAAACIAVLSAAALYLLLGTRFIGTHGIEPPTNHGMSSMLAAPVPLALVSGAVSVSGKTARAGDLLHEGSVISVTTGMAVFSFDNKTAAIVEDESRLTLLAYSNNAVHLKLAHGLVTFHVTPLTNGQSFVVDMPKGQIQVLGTIFSISSTMSGYEVRVLDGLVFFQPFDGDAIVVAAGQVLDAGHGLHRLTDAARDEILRKTRLLELLSGDTMGFRAIKDSRSKLVERPRGEEPPGGEPSLPSSTPGPVGPHLTDNDLSAFFEQVRYMRSRRDWDGVMKIYQQMIRLFPDSPEARTSLVTMGQIQLLHLKQSQAAIASFKKYLRSPGHGSLAEEAEWGIVLSLRDLGNTDQEARACMRFLRHYPRSLYAPWVKQRIKVLARPPQ